MINQMIAEFKLTTTRAVVSRHTKIESKLWLIVVGILSWKATLYVTNNLRERKRKVMSGHVESSTMFNGEYQQSKQKRRANLKRNFNGTKR